MPEGHGIGADTEGRAPLFGNDFRKARDSGFGKAVVCLAGVSVDATGAGDVYDVPRLSVFDSEIRRCSADQPERSGIVECYDRIPLLVRHFMDDSIPGESSIVHNDMNLASSELCRSLDQRIDVGGIKHITRYCNGFAAGIVDTFGYCLGLRDVDVLNNDLGAFFREKIGRFGANTLP